MEPYELIRSAFDALLRNKLRSILTSLGVIIGVFAVIVLVSLGAGLQSYITNQIESLGSNLIFVVPGRVGGRPGGTGPPLNKLGLEHAKLLERKLSDEAIVGYAISKTTTVQYRNTINKNTGIQGVSFTYPKVIRIEVEKGVFPRKAQVESGKRIALIGKTVHTNLFAGDEAVGEEIEVSGKKYIVIGVLKARGSTFGIDQDNVVIVPYLAAKKQFGIEQLNSIFIAAEHSQDVKKVEQQVKKILATQLSEDDFSVLTQEQTLSTIGNITTILSIALGGIAAISLLVGGIGIMNIMLVSVTERTREIGLRKALGARNSDILRQFLLEAVVLSLSGGVVGMLLGIAGSLILGVFLVSTITPWSLALAFLFCTAIGIGFGMAPAIRASRLSPIEALRYE